MNATSPASKRDNWITLVLGADAEERGALAWAFLCFFSLLLGYYILRSVREAMIAADGTHLIPAVFTSVFICMLALMPVYGAIVSRFPRRRFLPVVYGVVIVSLVGFSLAFSSKAPQDWITLAFAIFLSVINLFTDSVFWSFMSDIFVTAQARRFYGIIAAGGTAGAIAGPLITRVIVGRVGVPNLLMLSACFYGLCLVCILKLVPWARRQEAKRNRQDGEKPIGGTLLAGFRLVVSKPLLFALVLFMFFGVSIGTLLYNEQASVVGAMHLDAAARTEYFAGIDLGVNLLALSVQLLLTRALLTRFGVGPLLLIPAVLMIGGLGSLVVWFSAGLLAAVQILTRGLSFSLIKPARESLFTLVDRESRYKAKNFIDTVVYRGADVATSWSYAALAGIGLGLPALAGAWVGVAIIFGAVVLWVIRLQHKILADPSSATE
ncbi:MAG TPA: MFS transporter [Rudaea sp.]|jgi:AAA family ATP:ADP antiporter|nr:MFS transporter [Rudaea sp.]